MIFCIFGLKVGSPGLGRCLKGLPEVVRFFVTECEAVGSHGDQIKAPRHRYSGLCFSSCLFVIHSDVIFTKLCLCSYSCCFVLIHVVCCLFMCVVCYSHVKLLFMRFYFLFMVFVVVPSRRQMKAF